MIRQAIYYFFNLTHLLLLEIDILNTTKCLAYGYLYPQSDTVHQILLLEILKMVSDIKIVRYLYDSMNLLPNIVSSSDSPSISNIHHLFESHGHDPKTPPENVTRYYSHFCLTG